jgi:hypothetical protein
MMQGQEIRGVDVGVADTSFSYSFA